MKRTGQEENNRGDVLLSSKGCNIIEMGGSGLRTSEKMMGGSDFNQ